MQSFFNLDNVNDQYLDFSVVKIIKLQELQCTLRELIHTPTGALIMHIENDDPENLFCLSFKTLPDSSNGAAHILEHTILCGSKQYPVKDPFFAMSRRSLNTFMNAMTGADFTCYPAASQVKKDFYNILEVYLDAVFHPQLKEMSFLQEGHRLELQEEQNPNSPLMIKGIVYNEMKGSLSARDNRLIQAMKKALFPELPYAFNSGGDPKEIPNLTYEELLHFHETYYHPSRCLFFFYGNFPLQEHLHFIAEKALHNVTKKAPLPAIKHQPRFLEPLYLYDRFPVEISENVQEQSIIAFGWLTVPLEDQQTLLALSVLDSAIMDTDASLLKLPIITSNLCIQAAAYIDTEMSEAPYIIFCKGCKTADAEKLQTLLFTTLEKIASEGIPHHLIESAIHQLEFSRMEIVGDQAPFGLTLFMRSALAKQHQCPPENALLIHSLFEDLLIRIKDPEYLPNLIRKYLLNNKHFVRLIMEPDPHLEEEEAKEEKERLAKIKEKLTPKELDSIILKTKELQEYQKKVETQSLHCLPKMAIEDIPVKSRDFSLHHEKIDHLEVFHHNCFTNHIVYADLIFDTAHIKEEELPYIQLLITLFTEVGSKDREYTANLEYIHAHTGGIGASSALYVQAQNPLMMKPCLTIRGKALNRKADKLFHLFHDLATSLDLTNKNRIKSLIEQLNNAMQNRLNRNALRYAIQLSLSGFSTPSFISESWSGLKYYQTIRDITSHLDTNLDSIIEKLISLNNRLFTAQSPHLVLGCDLPTFKELKNNQFYGLTQLPTSVAPLWQPKYVITPVSSQARSIASPVAFTSAAFKTVTYLHPHAPALAIATFIMDNTILHSQVREKGGAYGVGAHYASMLGQFYFHSYRDPHIARTIAIFYETIDKLATEPIDEAALEEAKFCMVQQLDTPIAPGSRALAAYSWRREGKSHEMRQKYRDQILALNAKEVQSAVETELVPLKDKGVIVTLSNLKMLERENLILNETNQALPIIPI